MAENERLILVVDDQPGVRRLMQEVFNEAGYRVLTAANGQEALLISAEQRPEVALVDMKMPVMDGLQTLRLLKSQHQEIIVFIMTAVGDVPRINEALSSGACSCISKPFDVFALRALVNAALQKGERE